MNELKVKVQQTPGTVTWNYEDLKKAITNALEVYKTTEYDDSNIGQAKKDRAMLNNLSKSVNARKIEIKKKCLEPYELIETQAKELMAIIQEPIAVIDERLTEYETARRKKARAVILEYMQKAFEGIEQQIADKAKNALYDDRWENATAKKSEWQTAIDARADAIRSDLQVLAGIEEKFRSYAMDAYRPNLRLADAMQKVQELRAQEAAILKRQQEEEERKRREEEERRRRQEELAKREAELAAQNQQEEAAQTSGYPGMVVNRTSEGRLTTSKERRLPVRQHQLRSRNQSLSWHRNQFRIQKFLLIRNRARRSESRDPRRITRR